MEIAGFVKPDFIVNVVPNADGDYRGHLRRQLGLRLAGRNGNWWTRSTASRSRDRADIVIASAGGSPRTSTSTRAGKTMDNASYAVKKGGAAIIVSECPDILRAPRNSPSGSSIPRTWRWKRRCGPIFIPGWVAWPTGVECSENGEYIMVTRPGNAEYGGKGRHHPVTTMEEALPGGLQKMRATNATIMLMPQGANTLPLLR